MKRRSAGCLLFSLAAAAIAAAPSSALALPYFQEVPNAFGMQPCQKAGCWTNYLRVTDIDGDGDLDVLFPNADGYFTKGVPTPFVIYANDGKGVFTDVSQQAIANFTGYLRQIAVGDVDGDGDPDIYAPAAWGDPDAFFINDGKGIFTDEAAARNPGVASHAGASRFADVDNDGDLDLFITDGWANGQNPSAPVHLYLNDGTGHFAEAMGYLPAAVTGKQPIDVDVFDADRDFDLDILINLHTGPEALWINDGTGHFTQAPFPPPQGNPLKYGPVACDVDGDGDLDVWVDNAGPNYTEQLLINDGTGKFADETAARVKGNVAGADDNGVTCVDVDGDGDFDAVIASLSDEERVLLNDGTGHFTLVAGGFSAAGDSTLWLEVGDMNGDGRLDVVTGQGESGSFLNRYYVGTMDVPVDTRAPAIIKVEQVSAGVMPGEAVPVRFAVSDNATSDEGPRLKRAYLKISAPMASEVEARFSGGDVFRGVIPGAASGSTVTFAACAIDRQGNEACSPDQTYTIVGPPDGSAATGSTSSSASGSGGGGAGSGSSAASGSSASSASSASSGGGAGGGGGFSLGDSGCGCAIPGEGGDGRLALVGLAAAIGMLARRRRRK